MNLPSRNLFFGQLHYSVVMILFDLYIIFEQVWTQKCAVQKASVDVNISYYYDGMW
jgi:hypothetical protein